MKLKDLAEIRNGLTLNPKLFHKEKKTDALYVQVLSSSDFFEGKSQYILHKEVRKLPNYSLRSILMYGDYIIYRKETEYKLYRYESTSGQTVAGEGIIVVRQNYGILKDYFGFEKNKKYFFNELKSIERTEGKITAENISGIEIGVNDILELENANIAEHIGIRKPVDIVAHPINIIQKPLPADKLIKRIDNNELLLDTDFQRRPDLWDYPTKSRLIESMLIGLAIPAFYFDGSNDDEWIVIDGLQRLSAMNGFIKGNFNLSGLDYLSELEDKSFIDLDRKYQRKIEEYEVVVYIIGKGTLPSIKYKIFKTINTSALRLTNQEIRHAINPGCPAMLLKRIASLDWFKRGLLIPSSERDRMYDREIALRFIAFNRKNFSEYTPTIVDFLDTAMTAIADEIPAYDQELLVKELENVFGIAYDTLGENAFSRSLFDNSRTYPHNNIMFELITYGISILSKKQRERLLDPNTHFKDIIIKHFEEKPDKYWDTDMAYTKENLIKRFTEIETLFKKLVL
jgi:hypothetical protein